MTYHPAHVRPYQCHTEFPMPHPWYPEQIPDCACGYDEASRHEDVRCAGCHRQHLASTTYEQVAEARVAGLGDAAQDQK